MRGAFSAARHARVAGLTLRDPPVSTWHDCRRLADGPYLAFYELEGLLGTSDALSKDSPGVHPSKERLPPKGSPWGVPALPGGLRVVFSQTLELTESWGVAGSGDPQWVDSGV